MAQQLPMDNLLEYLDLQQATLQRINHTHKQHRQQFFSLMLGKHGCLFAFAQQLRDTCNCWLRSAIPMTSSMRWCWSS